MEWKMPENATNYDDHFQAASVFCWKKWKRQCHRSLGIISYVFSSALVLQNKRKNEKKHFITVSFTLSGSSHQFVGNTRIPKRRVLLRDISSVRICQTFFLTCGRNQNRQNKKIMIYWLLSGVVGPGRDWGIFSNPARHLDPFGNRIFSSLMSKCSDKNHYLFSSLTSFGWCSLTWLRNLFQSRSIISSMRSVKFCISEIRHSMYPGLTLLIKLMNIYVSNYCHHIGSSSTAGTWFSFTCKTTGQ